MPTTSHPVLPPLTGDAPLEEALQRAQAGAALPELAAFAAAPDMAPAWSAQPTLTDASPGRWSVWAAGQYLQAQFAPDRPHPPLQGQADPGQDTLPSAASVMRLSRTLGSCALLRQALVQALSQARAPLDRSTQPLLRSVLGDMALESEAALTLAMRLAQAFECCDDAATTTSGHIPPIERAWKRVMAPAAQFWIGRRAMEVTGETMEWAGAQGALDSAQGQALARLFLTAPAHGRGEGTGNALCLEVLQALDCEKARACVLLQALEDMAGDEPRILAQLHALRAMLAQPPAEQQALARMLVQRLVLTAQACLLHQHAPPAVAQAFITSRLAQTGAGRVLGALDTRHMDVAWLLRRAVPENTP